MICCWWLKKGVRAGICPTNVHRYAKANNKYMKNYDRKTILYPMYLDENNLYGWAMSQKLPENSFKWVEELSQFNKDLIKDYDQNSDEGYFLEVDVEYPKKLFSLHNDLPFLPEKNKIKKCNKLICNVHGKGNYVVHIALKEAFNHVWTLKQLHKVIKFNQKAWLKPYIDMNTKLRTDAKNDFEKDFFKLMNNAVFGKTMENVRKHRDIKLVTTDKRRNQLASEPNYHTTKYFSENLIAIETEKTKVKMNKPIYLGMSILDISKTLMHEFWYYFIKPKYRDKAKLCYMDTDSFIIHIKAKDFYEDIADDFEKWFDTSN